MKPELMKYYRIDYINSDNEDDNYQGIALCLNNDVPTDLWEDSEEPLYFFRTLPDGQALFNEDDIVEEVEAKEVWK